MNTKLHNRIAVAAAIAGLLITLCASGCWHEPPPRPPRPPVYYQQPPRIPVTPPVVPAPTPSVVTPQPQMPAQQVTSWVHTLSSKAEAGVRVDIVADNNTELAARIIWNAPAVAGAYFVGLGVDGRVVMVDWTSRGKSQGTLDGMRVDIEKVTLWAVRSL